MYLRFIYIINIAVILCPSYGFSRGGASRAYAQRLENSSHGYASNCKADPVLMKDRINSLIMQIEQNRAIDDQTIKNTDSLEDQNLRGTFGVSEAWSRRVDAKKREGVRESGQTCHAEKIYMDFMTKYGHVCADIGAIRNGPCAELSYNGLDWNALLQRGTADSLRTARGEFRRFAGELDDRSNTCSTEMASQVLNNEACNSLLESTFTPEAYGEECSVESIEQGLRSIAGVLDDRAYIICTIYDDQLQHRRSQRIFENKELETARLIACLEEPNQCGGETP